MASNEGSQSDSRLLSLSAELRNTIYELVLTVHDGDGDGIRMRKSPSAGAWKPSVLALLQTCRQIHEEASGIFYHENTLRITAHSQLSNFISTIGHSRKVNIRSLRVDFHTCPEGTLSPGGRACKACMAFVAFTSLSNAIAAAAFGKALDKKLRREFRLWTSSKSVRSLRDDLVHLTGLSDLNFSLEPRSVRTEIQIFSCEFQKAVSRVNEEICATLQEKAAEKSSAFPPSELEA